MESNDTLQDHYNQLCILLKEIKIPDDTYRYLNGTGSSQLQKDIINSIDNLLVSLKTYTPNASYIKKAFVILVVDLIAFLKREKGENLTGQDIKNIKALISDFKENGTSASENFTKLSYLIINPTNHEVSAEEQKNDSMASAYSLFNDACNQNTLKKWATDSAQNKNDTTFNDLLRLANKIVEFDTLQKTNSKPLYTSIKSPVNDNKNDNEEEKSNNTSLLLNEIEPDTSSAENENEKRKIRQLILKARSKLWLKVMLYSASKDQFDHYHYAKLLKHGTRIYAWVSLLFSAALTAVSITLGYYQFSQASLSLPDVLSPFAGPAYFLSFIGAAVLLFALSYYWHTKSAYHEGEQDFLAQRFFGKGFALRSLKEEPDYISDRTARKKARSKKRLDFAAGMAAVAAMCVCVLLLQAKVSAITLLSVMGMILIIPAMWAIQKGLTVALQKIENDEQVQKFASTFGVFAACTFGIVTAVCLAHFVPPLNSFLSDTWAASSLEKGLLILFTLVLVMSALCISYYSMPYEQQEYTGFMVSDEIKISPWSVTNDMRFAIQQIKNNDQHITRQQQYVDNDTQQPPQQLL